MRFCAGYALAVYLLLMIIQPSKRGLLTEELVCTLLMDCRLTFRWLLSASWMS
jgi:hypothetical protein